MKLIDNIPRAKSYRNVVDNPGNYYSDSYTYPYSKELFPLESAFTYIENSDNKIIFRNYYIKNKFSSVDYTDKDYLKDVIFSSPIIKYEKTIRTYYKSKRLNKEKAINFMFKFNNILLMISTGNEQVYIHNGRISVDYKDVPYTINNCLGVNNILSNSFNKKFVLASFIITKKGYYDYKVRTAFSEDRQDFDYDQIKFYVDPMVYEKGFDIKGLKNFIEKSIIPICDKTGIKVIKEPIDYVYNPKVGAGYSTEGIIQEFTNLSISNLNKLEKWLA